MNKPNVIAIGYAKKALEAGSRDRERMCEYASVLGCYHLIVFTRKAEHFPAVQQEGSLILYATNARTKIGQLWRAVQIGRSIIKQQSQLDWIVSSQDPFETSLVASGIIFGNKNTRHHIQIHGDVFNHLFFSASLLNRLRRMFAERIVQKAAAIRVVSSRIKESLLKLHISESKITILPIQPELDTFLAVGKGRIYATHEALHLLYVGRFSPEKNIPLLLKAAAKANTADVPISLTLIGSGSEKTTLQKLAEELQISERVTFVEWTNDVPAAMAQVDVLCLSSLHEGYALVLLEAMAAGLPIITTDVGCVGEVVVNDIHGKVVSVNNVDEYTAAITFLAQHPSEREVYGKNGFETALALSEPREKFLTRIQQSFTIA